MAMKETNSCCPLCRQEIFYSAKLGINLHRCASGQQHYIMDANHNTYPVSIFDYREWDMVGDFRNVARDTIGNYEVITSFLGLDHNHSNFGPPILFETMIFSAEEDEDEHGFQGRYSTWDEAVRGHRLVVDQVNRVYRAEQAKKRRQQKKLEAKAAVKQEPKRTYTETPRSITFEDE